MATPNISTQIRLLVQVGDHEPRVAVTGAYEATVAVDDEGRMGVTVSPEAIRDAVRDLFKSGLEKIG